MELRVIRDRHEEASVSSFDGLESSMIPIFHDVTRCLHLWPSSRQIKEDVSFNAAYPSYSHRFSTYKKIRFSTATVPLFKFVCFSSGRLEMSAVMERADMLLLDSQRLTPMLFGGRRGWPLFFHRVGAAAPIL